MREQANEEHETYSTLEKVHKNSKILKQDLTDMRHQLHLELWEICV